MGWSLQAWQAWQASRICVDGAWSISIMNCFCVVSGWKCGKLVACGVKNRTLWITSIFILFTMDTGVWFLLTFSSYLICSLLQKKWILPWVYPINRNIDSKHTNGGHISENMDLSQVERAHLKRCWRHGIFYLKVIIKMYLNCKSIKLIFF